MLEQSMGKLRDLLAEQGINLGESSVSEQGGDNEQLAHQSGSEGELEGELENHNVLSEQIVSKQQDGIDFYA